MQASHLEVFKPHDIKIRTVTLFGMNIHACSMSEAIAEIDEAITHRKSLSIGMLNAAKIVNMRGNIELQESVLSSDLIMADGASVVMASKILGHALPERVAGIDLMQAILAFGDQQRYRIFCLGATESVSQKVQEHIKEHYPNIILSGRHHGYYSEEEEHTVVLDIANSNSDVLLVAMTSPKKEQFMAKYNDIMRVPVIHGVGGSFDVVAGKVERAPIQWQKYGLEWLYRLKQEPRRLFYRYFRTNSIFIYLLIRELIKPTPVTKSTEWIRHK